MPPKRKRPDTDSNDEEAQVLAYLTRTNRPYSAGKWMGVWFMHTAAQKILTQLAEQGQIVCKTYGKQQIYFVVQTDKALPSSEELQVMDQQIEQCKKDGLTGSMTTDDAEKRLKELEQANKQMEDKLVRLRQGNTLIDPKERKRIDQNYDRYRGLWKARKKMFYDIFSAITEHHPGKPKTLLDEMGIETDEDVKVHWDDYTIAQ
ncbi:Tat binding protein 1-interacting protein-domain-containing protein [Syncephalis pseudoplumigaleata]|uniref:Homologous-pairing protein 2 homolog n=1 Tax=Syncephalis pseudoplumigaleata TaxID=1712513 RepID=A0A4P9Z1L4_9FUNG|nr:Tat binding protein 1-interacting protein-domain-containing protein [Syncephalis pseudoplumigaleata]|eukprot:RKP25310.1 Tat binding protein 1-interacting protein-domain-containing protein [Syncephalis pseudoplumigaleata]